VLTTHYLEEAEELADRIGVIDHGRLLLVEEKRALLARHGGQTLEEIYVGLVGRKVEVEEKA
jgi:ABC-2 type transport system ATP-binding protein